MFPFFPAFAKGDPEVKQVSAYRATETIHIDGILNEKAWQNAERATAFIQHSPLPGSKSSQENEIRIIYDNKAIYIAGYLHDDSPNEIDSDLSERDDIGQSDWFGIIIDSYQDGINALSFAVSSSGVQRDAKICPPTRTPGWRRWCLEKCRYQLGRSLGF